MTTNSEPGNHPSTSAWPMWRAVILVCLIAYLVLNLPDYPSGYRWQALARLPLELPLMLIAVLCLPRRVATVTAALCTLILMSALFLRAADNGVQLAFGRRFNPYLDTRMLLDGWHLLSGTIGVAMAGSIILLAVTLIVALAVVFFRSLRQMIDWRSHIKRRAAVVALAVLLAGLAVNNMAPEARFKTDFQATAYLRDRVVLMQKSMKDMREFDRQLASDDPAAGADKLFAGIKGRDVIVVFVESYGRKTLDDTQYSQVVRPRLSEIESQLGASGLASASGWLKSSTVGGQSWLAHGTFLSGLWVDSQARYDRLMISRRASLNRLFQQAGWHTSAVMPAITMDWPESAYFGYDQILVARNLQYRGKPYNWVTMPDQYTLSAFERLARQPARNAGKASMAEIALISSHAPWTPVAELVDWDQVGDGQVFNLQAESGEAPSAVWADNTKLRDHYIRTIDYSLQTLGDYMARFADNAIVIILGDHQPAYVVAGEIVSRAVPVHLISRDKALVQRFVAEGFSAGMSPAHDSPELPMDGMRDRLIRLFGAN